MSVQDTLVNATLLNEKEPAPARRKSRWMAALASFGSPVVAAIALKCPFCIPALGALLASLGVGYFGSLVLVRSALITLLLLSIACLVFSAAPQRRWFILLLSVASAFVVYASRYFWPSDLLLWIGAAGLMAMSLSNLKRKGQCSHFPPT